MDNLTPLPLVDCQWIDLCPCADYLCKKVHHEVHLRRCYTEAPRKADSSGSNSTKLLATIADFKPGTIIRGKSTGNVFTVTANYGARATAVMTQDICNPDEWEAIGS